ncbi:MAG: hypothetical protein IIC92_07435 [Chloroflexi bacterium]|nr:hypothetical protein [Chloroflexota bacterium]
MAVGGMGVGVAVGIGKAKAIGVFELGFDGDVFPNALAQHRVETFGVLDPARDGVEALAL